MDPEIVWRWTGEESRIAKTEATTLTKSCYFTRYIFTTTDRIIPGLSASKRSRTFAMFRKGYTRHAELGLRSYVRYHTGTGTLHDCCSEAQISKVSLRQDTCHTAIAKTLMLHKRYSNITRVFGDIIEGPERNMPEQKSIQNKHTFTITSS